MTTKQTFTNQQKFEAHVRLEEFIERVSPKGVLLEAAKGCEGIISTGDIQNLQAATPSSNLSATRIPDSELIDLFRLVREGEDKMVFARADIEFAPVQVASVLSIQTFVNANRLCATPSATSFLSQLGLDMNQAGAFAITIENGSGKYSSIFLPPIVTNYQKAYFETPLRNLEEMVAHGQGITMKGLQGDVSLDLATLLGKFNDDMAKPDQAISVVLDGNHRAYVCYLANVPMNAIVVNGEASPRNIPVRFEDIVVALERPEKSEDRYLGVVRTLPKLNLADLGIGQNR